MPFRVTLPATGEQGYSEQSLTPQATSPTAVAITWPYPETHRFACSSPARMIQSGLLFVGWHNSTPVSFAERYQDPRQGQAQKWTLVSRIGRIRLLRTPTQAR
jgi:hypothetical protein